MPGIAVGVDGKDDVPLTALLTGVRRFWRPSATGLTISATTSPLSTRSPGVFKKTTTPRGGCLQVLDAP
ncbi:MAG: hypothetical protein KJP23_22645 [Deltaproteobacteria bacterium]|nr:hypothetical protein [Deltaproteobacteria bacterium]